MEKNDLTNGQAAWIGVIAGCIPSLILGVILGGGLYGFYFLLPCIAGGLVGALAGRSAGRQSKVIVWVGSLLGAFLSGGFCFYLAFTGRIFS